MNVSELARKLRTTTKELLEILPVVGFDIGQRAIKVDDRLSRKILQNWPRLLTRYKESIVLEEEKVVESTKVVEKKSVAIPSLIRVKDFALKINLPISKVMAELMKNGVLSSMNEQIDFDTASIVGQELGFEIIADNSAAANQEAISKKLSDLLTETDDTKLVLRPPVVVVMGHVDHGKTKLLDAIRKTHVMEGESGGITQHIGAYQVTVPSKEPSPRVQTTSGRGIPPRQSAGRDDSALKRTITFIDTPGHEAFTAMRSRGAQIADIAILVVAADDSVQPQTKESIKIIHSAGLPMIVAINKIDKPEANIERVKQDLAALDLAPEEWGGKTICVPISAKAGQGLDDLLEMILLITDTLGNEVAANPNRSAVGTIIESHINKGEGPVATALVQNGTLRLGDLVTSADIFYGKIRAMKNFKGEEVAEATPSMPVKILGLKAAPSVGDILQVVVNVDRKARLNRYQLREQATAYTKPREIKEKTSQEIKTLNIVLKADVLGSLEAVISSLLKMEHPEVAVNILTKGLGNINESDVQRAAMSHGVVLGFNVKPTVAAENLAKEQKVEIKIYSVIYHLLDEAKAQLEKLLSPEIIRTDLGRVKILAVFYKEKNSLVVGGQVTKGKVVLHAKADVMRGDQKIGTGIIAGLQANKVKVNEAASGQECGISYEGRSAIETGDTLEIYTEEVKQKKII